MARPERHIRFETENGPNLGGLGLFVKGPRRVKIAVIRDGQTVHSEIANPRDQVRNAVRPVEQRVFRMRVEVDEAHSVIGCGTMLFNAAAQKQDGHEQIVPAGRLPMSESYRGSTTLSK